MAESFLEEQLKRIRQMTEQVSRVRCQAHEMAIEVARNRELLRYGPLQEVRDFRTYSSINEQSRERADDATRGRRHPSRETTRRRK